MQDGQGNDTCKAGEDFIFVAARTRDIWIQIVLSVALGLGAFLTFCVGHSQSWLLFTVSNHGEQFLRPRWKGLYAARKKQSAHSTALPELPDSFFGWIIPLWRITEEQVLASAGLDAYVVCMRLIHVTDLSYADALGSTSPSSKWP